MRTARKNHRNFSCNKMLSGFVSNSEAMRRHGLTFPAHQRPNKEAQ